jgi:ribose 5-phosphate isomerase A
VSTAIEIRKRAAAARALELVESGTILGLGTGSTVRPFLELLATALGTGSLTGITGVPTSEATAQQCRTLGIPLTTLDDHPSLELAVDGADEVGPRLALIKGMGGALLREKLVALAAKRFVVIADDSKRVRRLGTRSPLPVEVVPFGWTTHIAYLEKLGAVPRLRRGGDGEPYRTDGGHFILDCAFPRGISDPPALARALARRPGIVEDGLFLGLADDAFLAGAGGVRHIRG